MSTHRTATAAAIISLAAALILLQPCTAYAADPCTGFKWDVSKEHALFAKEAHPLAAGRNPSSAPAIGTDQLFDVTLIPQGEVTFVVPPGKKTSLDAAYAGLATLRLPSPGSYRVSADLPVWLDVIADDKTAPTIDFQGQHDCDAPHKIVEFDLHAAARFILQVSGAGRSKVRLTVTQVRAASG